MLFPRNGNIMKPHLATEIENSDRDFSGGKKNAISMKGRQHFPRLLGKINFLSREIVIGDFALIDIATQE
jgi:hypothetical protein